MPEAPETYTIFLHYLLYICGANCLAIPTPQRYHVTCQRGRHQKQEGTRMKKHTIKAKYTRDGWVDGMIDGFRFQAKVFDESSRFGINEGRVSKLMIWDESKRQADANIFKASILNYDRGWDIKPTKAADKEILAAVLEYLGDLPTAEFWETIAAQEPFRAAVRLKDGHVINARIRVDVDGWGTIQDYLTGNWHGKLDPIAIRDLLERAK
jgi:hypothetical protein